MYYIGTITICKQNVIDKKKKLYYIIKRNYYDLRGDIMKRIPVTVLSGYLGSGKTTLLEYILHHTHDMKIALIVNDMSEINIDATHIKSQVDINRTEEAFVEMTNGCICCTLRDDLIQEVKRIAGNGDIDYILIESTGISEPIPVAQTFLYEDEETGISLGDFTTLDTLVTVVDAKRFWHDFTSGESLLERKEALDETDLRDVVDLLIDQIECANVIVLNKQDMVEEEVFNQLKAVLQTLNPHAKVIGTSYGKVDIKELLHTKTFNEETMSQLTSWQEELEKEHIPETEEYGISSFVFKSKRPFHPERLKQWMDEWPDEIVRAKGLLWLASRNEYAIFMSQAGSSVMFDVAGKWLAEEPQALIESVLTEDPSLKADWDEVYGDRINEFVLIGIEMNEQTVRESLENCLLTEQELHGNWKSFKDEFPAFVEKNIVSSY